MGNIEQLEKIDFAKLDPKGMINHIERFPDMIGDAYDLSDKFTIPSYYIKAKKVILLGMGGSGQAGDIVKDLLSETDLIIESVHNYLLPGWVDKDTLVIANSYSGDTEEVLTGFISAYQKGAKLIAVTTGGKLRILAEKYKAPVLSFDYASPPRASFPYLFILLLSVFDKLGYINLSRAQIELTTKHLRALAKKYHYEVSSFQNPAKILAQKLHNKVTVVYSSEKLAGVGARIKASLNETGKNFAFNEVLPELNHKSLEGLINPKDMTHILMIESNFELEKNLIRENVTAEVLNKFKVPYDQVKFVQIQDRMSEICAHILFGDYVAYYTGILNKANPGINEVVDYFKARLV